MHTAYNQFKKNIELTKNQGQNAGIVRATFPRFDVSDIYRSQIVFAVSALDYFVHELIRIGMVEIAEGKRQETDAYKKFAIPIEHIQETITNNTFSIILSDYVRKRHKEYSFQSPDNINKHLKLITSKAIWNEVAKKMSIDTRSVKNKLEMIVDRRNKIAHESDIVPANPDFKWTITEDMALGAIEFVETIGEKIFEVVLLPKTKAYPIY